MSAVRLIRGALAGLMRPPGSPISLVHFVTERCNARCPHCFVDFSTDNAEQELRVEEIEAVARSLATGLVNVNLTGGEPFLRRDLWAVSVAYLEYARVPSIVVTSNGSLTERVSDYLEAYAASRYRCALQLAFSIDDFAADHDSGRQVKDGFARAMASYRLADQYRAQGVSPSIALTVTARNAERLPSLYRHLVADHGVRNFSLTAQRFAGVAPRLSRDEQVAIAQSYQCLVALMREDRRRGVLEWPRGAFARRALVAKNDLLHDLQIKNYCNGGAGNPPCPAADRFAVLRADGTVTACEVLPNSGLGNVRDVVYRMDHLLRNSTAGELRRRIAATCCHCTYECALGVALVSQVRFIIPLVRRVLRGKD